VLIGHLDSASGPEALESCSGHTHAPSPTLPSAAELERAAGYLRAAAEPARLRVLVQLASGERCVSELADSSGEGLSTTSQRLKLLRAEGLVVRRREGKHVYYALSDRHILDLVLGVIEHAREPPR
jgi:ArsR family transcriptional regulator